MFINFVDFSYYFRLQYDFIVFESIFFFLVLLVLLHLFFENKHFNEMRVLVFFIYFELIHLFLALLFLVWAMFDSKHAGIYMTTVLLLIGASGSETGLFLALFMRYYKLTGLTTFLKNDKVRTNLNLDIMLKSDTKKFRRFIVKSV